MTTTMGLVGCGRWGKLIARDLRELGCQVTAVARSAESVENARQAGAGVVGTIEDLPAQDGYVIASPTRSHVEHIRELLKRERPIFCEKPIGMRAAELEELPALANDLVYSMDKWRYHEGVLWLARCAREQTLGRVQGLGLIRVNGVSRQSNVTALWHLMPHDLSIALEILGHIPEARASTVSRLGAFAYQANVTLGSDPWVTIAVGERNGAHYREARLICEHGEATLSGAYADAIIVRRHSPTAVGAPERVAIGNTMPLLAELERFVAFARGRGPAPKSGLAEATVMVRRIEELHAMAGADPDAKPPC